MKYYININTDSNPNNNNEVHKDGCRKIPEIKNRKLLGEFRNGIEAVNYAKAQGFHKADGCALCCPEAHRE